MSVSVVIKPFCSNLVGEYTDKNCSSITTTGKLKFNPKEEYLVNFNGFIFSVNKKSNEISILDMNSFSKKQIKVPNDLKSKNLKIFSPFFIFDDKNKFYLTTYKSGELKVFAEIKKTDKNRECKILYEEPIRSLLQADEYYSVIVGPPKDGNIFELIRIQEIKEPKPIT